MDKTRPFPIHVAQTSALCRSPKPAGSLEGCVPLATDALSLIHPTLLCLHFVPRAGRGLFKKPMSGCFFLFPWSPSRTPVCPLGVTELDSFRPLATPGLAEGASVVLSVCPLLTVHYCPWPPAPAIMPPIAAEPHGQAGPAASLLTPHCR